MSNHFMKTLEQSLDNPNLSREELKTLLENIDFFLKILRVRLESPDLEMQKQAFEELSAFKQSLQKRFPSAFQTASY